MRAREFIQESMGATCSGAVATVAQPIGEIISRQIDVKKAKYSNAAVKPWPTRKIKNAR